MTVILTHVFETPNSLDLIKCVWPIFMNFLCEKDTKMFFFVLNNFNLENEIIAFLKNNLLDWVAK